MIDQPHDCIELQQQYGQTSPSQSAHTHYTLQETCQTSPDKKNDSKLYANQVKKKQSILAKLCPCFNLFQQKKSKEELAAENVIKEFTEGEKETRGPVEIPFQDEDNRGKKTLVLDLDETLVTSSCLEFPSADLKIKVNLKDGRGKNIWVKFRPDAQFFLREISELYEIIIFTASIREYASAVIDFLDVQCNVSLRLFRENCSKDSAGGFYKDIRKIHRDIENIIIIDNQASQFKKSPENGIQISDFKIDNKTDCELSKLIPFLRFMSGVKDVRSVPKYLDAYVAGEVINYIDVNDMESEFQRGAAIEEERLATEKTESKIEQVDMGGLREEEQSSASGNTIKLDSRDYYKKQADTMMMRHFEDDIDVAMKIQEDMNQKQKNQESMNKSNKSRRHNQFLSSIGGSGSIAVQLSARGDKKEEIPIAIGNGKKNKNEESSDFQKQININKQQTGSSKEPEKQQPQKIKKGTKSAFDFTAFKSSLYNKLVPEKENLSIKSNDPDKHKLAIEQTCTSPNSLMISKDINYQDVQTNVQDHSSVQNLSKGFIDTNQTQNADNSNHFIVKQPKSYKKQPHQRRCVSQAINFAEVSLSDENYNSPTNYKEI